MARKSTALQRNIGTILPRSPKTIPSNLKLIAETLGLEFETTFGEFCRDEASAVRLLHYPPQSLDHNEQQLGTGAHTD